MNHGGIGFVVSIDNKYDSSTNKSDDVESEFLQKLFRQSTYSMLLITVESKVKKFNTRKG